MSEYKKGLLKGTLILTAAGLISRIAGFFYKIFLSRAIGAEQIGIYQLAMPLYLLAFSRLCHRHSVRSVPAHCRPVRQAAAEKGF